jgi:hypothetical protein
LPARKSIESGSEGAEQRSRPPEITQAEVGTALSASAARPWTLVFRLYPLPARPTCSDDIEFSVLNGNLMVPARHLSIFNWTATPVASGQGLYKYEQQ